MEVGWGKEERGSGRDRALAETRRAPEKGWMARGWWEGRSKGVECSVREGIAAWIECQRG